MHPVELVTIERIKKELDEDGLSWLNDLEYWKSEWEESRNQWIMGLLF